MSSAVTPRQRRIQVLRKAQKRIEDELLVLLDAERQVNEPRRMQPLECGSEQAYQRHAHFGDTATDQWRVGCEPCRAAHAEHERARAAVRRAMRRLAEAS